MKTSYVLIALMLSACVPGTADTLYDNTVTDTLDTVLYSTGPFTQLGDQIQLASAGTATEALVQMYNNGGPGTFDAELQIYDLGSPVGSLLGAYDLDGNTSAGSDVLNLTFELNGGLAVPGDIIFLVSVGNESAGLDLGLDLFEPPIVGSSDNSFMIAAASGQTPFELATNSENVFFKLTGTAEAAAPEASSAILCGTGLLLAVLIKRRPIKP